MLLIEIAGGAEGIMITVTLNWHPVSYSVPSAEQADRMTAPAIMRSHNP